MSVVTTLSALKENSPQEFEVDGIDVVLVRTDGEVFAVGATCTHAEVPMVDGEVVDVGGDERLTVMEARQGLAERAFSFTLVKGRPLPAGGLSMRYKTYAASASRMDLKLGDSKPWTWKYWSGFISMLWSTERMLRLRVWLSKRHRAWQHSSHWRHGLKNAIGVAVLSFPAFMPESSSGTLCALG